MRATDTNVLVRLLTNDDKVQAQAARRAFEEGDIFIAVTVLLETEWVLRSAYAFAPAGIAAAFRGLAGLPTVTIDEPNRLARALEWMELGMDFADALHLARADGCAAFLSFDRRLAAVARAVGVIAVQAP